MNKNETEYVALVRAAEHCTAAHCMVHTNQIDKMRLTLSNTGTMLLD